MLKDFWDTVFLHPQHSNPETLGAGRVVDIYSQAPLYDLAILCTACAWLVPGRGDLCKLGCNCKGSLQVTHPETLGGHGDMGVNGNACTIPNFISSDILLCPHGLENSLELVAILIK